MTIRQEELREAAEVASENGHDEKADELFLLSGDGKEQDEPVFVNPNEPGIDGVCMADIEPEEIPFFWPGWLPIGVTLAIGEGGVGKSTVFTRIAADASRDRPMPDGEFCLPGKTIWVSLEEEVASQVVPRFIANDADRKRIYDLHEVTRPITMLGQPDKSRFMLPDDLPALEKLIKRIKNVSLVVLDPLMLVVNPKVSTARGQSAGDLMLQLNTYAMRLGIAFVIIGHFTKGTSKDVIQRIGGSKIFTNTARSIIVVTASVSTPGQAIMHLQKHNLSGPRPDIAYVRNADGSIEFLTGQNEEQTQIGQNKKYSAARNATLALLSAHPEHNFTTPEVAQEIGVDYMYANRILRHVVANDGVVQDVRGFYHMPTVATPEPVKFELIVPRNKTV